MIKKIKKILTESCILFTVFVFIVLTVNSLFSSPNDGVVTGISLEASALLFICAVLLRLYHGVLYAEKLPMVLRVIINYVLVVATGFANKAVVWDVDSAYQHGNKPSAKFAQLIYNSFGICPALLCGGYYYSRGKAQERRKEKSKQGIQVYCKVKDVESTTIFRVLNA